MGRNATGVSKAETRQRLLLVIGIDYHSRLGVSGV